MIIILSPLRLVLGMCVVFGVGVAVGINAGIQIERAG